MTDSYYVTDRGGPGEVPAGTFGRLQIEVCHDGAFRVSDRVGYLCTTNSTWFLGELAKAERRAFPDPTRPHLYYGAREYLFPGFAEEREKEQIAFWKSLRKARSKPSDQITLADLGL